MKKQLLFLGLMCLVLCPLLGQSYQCFRSDRTALYNTPNSSFGEHPIKSVSVQFWLAQPDSNFFFQTNIISAYAYCFTPYGMSWFGRNLVIRPDGSQIFLNEDNDSIRIQTNAMVGDSWLCYAAPNDSLTIMASVTQHDTLRFLGQLDSVKTIRFWALDEEGDSAAHHIDQNSLILSKNYGLVKTLNFRVFPKLVGKNFYPTDYLVTHSLVGLTQPELGLQNLRWLDVHDHQVGDELHVWHDNYHFEPSWTFRQTKRTIFRFLARAEYADSLVYQVEKTEEVEDTEVGNSFTLDTLRTVYVPNPVFDNLPQVPVADPYMIIAHNMSIDGHIRKGYEDIGLSQGSSGCWDIVYDIFTGEEYWKGLGGPYYRYESEPLDYGERKLRYYKKGEENWGNPFLLTGLEKQEPLPGLQVFPNPSQGMVWVQVAGDHSSLAFELYNMQGQTVLRKSLHTNRSQVEVRGLPPGLYSYQVSDEQGRRSYGKLILEE